MNIFKLISAFMGYEPLSVMYITDKVLRIINSILRAGQRNIIIEILHCDFSNEISHLLCKIYCFCERERYEI